jgi:diguanylate cyclase (GGDEF)-like protein
LKAVSNTLAAALDRIASDAQRRETINQLAEVEGAIPGIIFRRRHLPDGEIVYDYLSQRCEDIFGVDPSACENQAEALLGRVHVGDRQRVRDTLFEISADSVPGEIEFRVHDPNGHIRWLRTTYTVTPLADGAVRVDGVDLDVTERRQAEQQAEYGRLYDPTTDLPNRTLVEQRLEEALAGARNTSRTVGVAMLDLDSLSRINNVYGRTVGDSLLRTVGEWLQQAVWPRDTVARPGGDQFAVVFHALRDSADAHRLVGKLLSALNRTFPVTDADSLDAIRPTACIGFAIYPRDGSDAEGLMNAADSALARARTQGAASYAFYSPEFTRETERYLRLEKDLQRAIENAQFRLHYQPQVDARSYKVTGVEALVRWQHPERGLLSPAHFMDVAEGSGLICMITREVVRQACATIADWRRRGGAYPDPALFSQRAPDVRRFGVE